MKMLKINEPDVLELLHWARRYCDGRSTFAPSRFNEIYHRITEKHPFLQDDFDCTLTADGKFWPWAQDGMYNSESGFCNTIPMTKRMRRLTQAEKVVEEE